MPLCQGCFPGALGGKPTTKDLQLDVIWDLLILRAAVLWTEQAAADAGGVGYPGLVQLPAADPETEVRHMCTFCSGRLKYVIASKSWYGSD